MAAEPHSPEHPPGPKTRAPVVEDAAVVMHREFVAAMRALARHILETADLVEAEPFNDAAMQARGARCAELDARVRAACEKFEHARFCTGGIQ